MRGGRPRCRPGGKSREPPARHFLLPLGVRDRAGTSHIRLRKTTMLWIWLGFVAFVLALLALDLGVFHRKDHEIKPKEALAWSAVWISVGLLFSVFVYFGYERHWMGMGLTADP